MLLVLRLVLVPIFIALVTLAARRWGPRAAAFVTALPAVAGPTLVFYAVQQGRPFAAQAAGSTMLGLVGVAAFCLVYGHGSTRLRWFACLLIGWMSFGVVTTMFRGVTIHAIAGLAIAVSALMVVRQLLPPPGPMLPNRPAPRWDLPMRMVSAAALVFALTSAAERLGPTLSGLLTPFPVATAIIAGFIHAQQGTGAVLRFLRGYMPGLCSFAVFCFVLAVMLPAYGVAATFAAALATQIAAQGIMLGVLKND